MQTHVTLGVVLDYLRMNGWTLPPRLARFLTRASELPAFAATAPAADEAMPAAPL